MTQSRRGREQERGQIIVLFVFVLIVIMGAAAMVIDVGVLRNSNQNLWNALDAGALAGASQLPADASNADAIALQYADMNYPGGLPSGVTVGFRCVIGSVSGCSAELGHPGGLRSGPQCRLDLQRQDLFVGLRPRRGRYVQYDRPRIDGHRPLPFRASGRDHDRDDPGRPVGGLQGTVR